VITVRRMRIKTSTNMTKNQNNNEKNAITNKRNQRVTHKNDKIVILHYVSLLHLCDWILFWNIFSIYTHKLWTTRTIYTQFLYIEKRYRKPSRRSYETYMVHERHSKLSCTQIRSSINSYAASQHQLFLLRLLLLLII